jgi:glycosyltransferase involved in cell wall biosynthesis
MRDRLIIICNALDDKTRMERGIDTDSPAASRKVFLMASAVRCAGARPHILSFARGRQDGSGRFYRCAAVRRRGISVINLPFLNIPILSELVSLFAPIPVLIRLWRFKGRTTVVFYNSMAIHVPALVTAALLRFRTVLDLEDGDTGDRRLSVRHWGRRFATWMFELQCTGGALLANKALGRQIRLRPTRCYYGTVRSVGARPDWHAPALRVLLGGTVSRDTGARQLSAAIRALRHGRPDWCASLRFEITGKGDCLEEFSGLVSATLVPAVQLHGRLSDGDYDALVARCHVGLALKPYLGDLAQTTFPSKVIELANAGQLIVTTDISDVRAILGSNALYLTSASPEDLIQHLKWIEGNRRAAAAMAAAGAAAVRELCAPEVAGRQLSDFLFAGGT